MPTAAGSFEVTMTPQPADERPAASTLGRMLLDKTFAGDLVATSVGQMLAYRSVVAGSAGYVAIERVTGTLAGRRGSFVLQHSGAMAIDASGGAHRYTFDYVLPT